LENNSIYTITAPDLMATATGPSISVLSTSDDFLREIERLHENLFKSVPVTIYHWPNDLNNLAWLIAVMHLSNNIFVHMDTVNTAGLVSSLLTESNVVYINENQSNRQDIVKLFNTMSDEHFVYHSADEYMTSIMSDMAN